MLVLELVEGDTLAARLRAVPLPVLAALRIASEGARDDGPLTASAFGRAGRRRQKYGPALSRLAVRSSHVERPAHSPGPHWTGLWSALMPTEPLTLAALARFHRKVIAPDFERVVGRLDRIEARLGDIDSHFDAIYDRFQRPESSSSGPTSRS